MNDIAKKSASDKFLSALKKEELSKSEAGACVGLEAEHVSYLFNEKYWNRFGQSKWDNLLAWCNSGQSLKEYSEKHGKVFPIKPEKIITKQPKKESSFISATDIKSDPKLIKEGKELSEKITLINLLKERKTVLIDEINAIDNLLRHYTRLMPWK